MSTALILPKTRLRLKYENNTSKVYEYEVVENILYTRYRLPNWKKFHGSEKKFESTFEAQKEALSKIEERLNEGYVYLKGRKEAHFPLKTLKRRLWTLQRKSMKSPKVKKEYVTRSTEKRKRQELATLSEPPSLKRRRIEDDFVARKLVFDTPTTNETSSNNEKLFDVEEDILPIEEKLQIESPKQALPKVPENEIPTVMEVEVQYNVQGVLLPKKDQNTKTTQDAVVQCNLHEEENTEERNEIRKNTFFTTWEIMNDECKQRFWWKLQHDDHFKDFMSLLLDKNGEKMMRFLERSKIRRRSERKRRRKI